jgi:hypothetical protein
MADDERRIDARPLSLSGSTHATREGIRELQVRHEKMTRLHDRPEQPFAEVLASRAQITQEQPAQKDLDFKKLPKRGPSPGLVHPSQRDAYGLTITTDEDIILKG